MARAARMAPAIVYPVILVLIAQRDLQSAQWTAQVMVCATLMLSVLVILVGQGKAAT